MSLDLIHIRSDLVFPRQGLEMFLPDVETALFFAMLYDLTAEELSGLLRELFNTDLMDALFMGDHSTELQDYILDDLDVEGVEHCFDTHTEHIVPQLLPQMWEQIRVEVAQSIKDVATKLGTTVQSMPGKQGQMLFKSMMTINSKRPVVGDYKAHIHHARQVPNLVILDVSASMSEPTVREIVGDVVALAYQANAHLAIVSNSSFHWEPGGFSTASVLKNSQFSGTHYESLAPLLQQNWGTVVTIADYDSSEYAKDFIKRQCSGTVEEVLDISLVSKSTYLSECVGQLSSKSVRPLLIASPDATLVHD